MAESEDDGFKGWPDWMIEGYWEVVDIAAHLNSAQGNDEMAKQCQALVQECEEELQARWANK